MKKKKSFFKQKAQLPVWLMLLLLLNAGVAGALLENYSVNKKYSIGSSQVSPSPTQGKPDTADSVKSVAQKVVPVSGYRTGLKWGDIGKKLVDSGAIDAQKFKQLFSSEANGKADLDILDGNSEKLIEINENNSRFLVDALWALGLVNKSKVLDEGLMKTSGNPIGNFASTGGWTLGSKKAVDIYSSTEIIPLDDGQQERIKQISENVYRPCCGNSTAFPDCNHGMAALGYIELAVANGLSDEQIYKDLLAFNSYWFPTNYVEMGVYFAQQGTDWEKVDPKLALSQDYSSNTGAQKIHQAVANVPGIQSQGGSCGA